MVCLIFSLLSSMGISKSCGCKNNKEVSATLQSAIEEIKMAISENTDGEAKDFLMKILNSNQEQIMEWSERVVVGLQQLKEEVENNKKAGNSDVDNLRAVFNFFSSFSSEE